MFQELLHRAEKNIFRVKTVLKLLESRPENIPCPMSMWHHYIALKKNTALTILYEIRAEEEGRVTPM